MAVGISRKGDLFSRHYYSPERKTLVIIVIETENPNAAPIGTKFGFDLFGDPLEIRTPDPLLKRQLLCLLS